ncbi:MAG: 4'-phosphopantetheinyl transferase superfamily protein [Firmicutes bacterium]|nr:4'-phosphopantetheinyl transferase superfamily protein [Bacillota bacterium]
MIRVYVFAIDEKSSSSDGRIYECAGRFLSAEQAGAHIPSNAPIYRAPFPAIVRGEWKKPRFEHDIGIFFSVSHSGVFFVCAVSDGGEVGIDIQKMTAGFNPGIPKRFFHPDEHRFLESSGSGDSGRDGIGDNIKSDGSSDSVHSGSGDFFKVWTAKEAYVKFTGSGIDGGFDAFSVVKDGRIRNEIDGARLRFLDIHPEYCMCLCAGDAGDAGVELVVM